MHSSRHVYALGLAGVEARQIHGAPRRHVLLRVILNWSGMISP